MRKNHLLNTLPADELQNSIQDLELVVMSRGMLLYESGKLGTHAYFPTSGVVSLSLDMVNGERAQIAVVGNEGMVGTSAFMGGDLTSSRVEVICAGLGYRIASQPLLDAFNRTSRVRKTLLRYTQVLMMQMAQTAVCNRFHRLEPQLCNLLLHCGDRFHSNCLCITQERMAHMLGVRREGVTHAALKLQDLGLIRYARGHVEILDRLGMEQQTCACYTVVKAEYDRLLPVSAQALPVA